MVGIVAVSSWYWMGVVGMDAVSKIVVSMVGPAVVVGSTWV